MSEKLRILITGFGPFPGAPFNPTHAAGGAADCSCAARRSTMSNCPATSFTVTYSDGRSRIAAAAGKAPPACAADVRPRRPHRLSCGSRPAPATPSPRSGPTPTARASRKGSIVGGADAMMFGPHTAKLLRAALRHRHRCAGLARCRQLSLQLSELARDRGDAAATAARASPPSSTFRCSRATAPRRKGAAHRITLEELVDAGEAMLLEMVRLTRQAARA